MGKDTYYEVTRRTIPIIKNEAAHLSWNNNILSVRLTKRLNFFEYSYNLECLDKKLDLIESCLSSPKDSPATDLCNSKFIRSEMRNIDYTEMIVNSSFWPHNASLTQEMTSIAMIEWSPPNYFKHEAVLAVLNNIGGVEFFGHPQLKWKSLLNLTPHVISNLQYNKSPKVFEELKESVYIVETSAICWARDLNTDKSCYFVTAQKNGNLLFWKIHNDMKTVNLVGSKQTDLTEINQMLWIQKPDNKKCLICADSLGLINMYEFKIEENKINVNETHSLWKSKDRMIAHNLNYMVLNNHIVFICSKHRHLLIQVLDKSNKVVTEYLNNVNDHRIVQITITNDGIYLATVNVQIYKMIINYIDGHLSVDLTALDIKDPFTNHDLFSLQFSKNNMLCALAMIDRKVLCRKEQHKIQIAFLSTDAKLESALTKLMDSPTKKLTEYWDCIELLRFQITKLKVTPKVDFDALYQSGLQNIYVMKIYLVLVIFFSNLKKVLRLSSNVNLPEMSVETVRERILNLHAKSIVEVLRKKYQKEGQLTEDEIASLYGSKKYLEYYASKYKTNLDLDKNVFNVVKNNFEYTCQCCDSKIDGFTCGQGHLNMFCMETFTPITGYDYLLCRSCGTTAKCELLSENPTCVFCDMCLVRPD